MHKTLSLVTSRATTKGTGNEATVADTTGDASTQAINDDTTENPEVNTTLEHDVSAMDVHVANAVAIDEHEVNTVANE
jgi:hypothetical protein